MVVRFIAKSYDIVYDVNRAVRNENDVLPDYGVTFNGGGIQTTINKDANPQTVKVENYHFDDIIDSDSYVDAFYGLSANAVSGIKFYGWRIAGAWSEPITETSPYGILLDENNFILYSLEKPYIETQTENSASRAAFATTVKSAQNNLVNFLPSYNSEINAYAIWKIEKTTVKIYANDNDGGSTVWNRGNTKSFELVYYFGDNFLFVDNNVVKFNNDGTKVDLPTRLGYRLLGFDKSSNPTSVLNYLIYDANDQVITDSIVTAVGTLSLYCYWQAKTYTVKFELDDEIPDLFTGTSYGAGVSYYVNDLLTLNDIANATNARVKIGFDKDLSIPDVNCVGYNFTGWENDFAKVNMSGDDADKRVYPNSNARLTYDFFDKSASTIDDNTIVVFKATWVKQYVKVVVYYSPEHNLGGSEVVFNDISNNANTDVAWIDKDYNGANNGVTKTLETRATTTEDSYVASGIQFNINIPYLLGIGLAGLSENDAKNVPIPIIVPEACGYTFEGLYYRDPDNGTTTQYFNKDGELSHQWDIAWDNVNPVVLYAKWTMKEYNVSLKIDSKYADLFNGEGLKSSPNGNVWSSDSGLPAIDGLQSSLKLVYTVYDQNGKAIDGKTDITISSPQTNSIKLKFYQKLVVNLTMAEGHYLYSIGGNEISYTASEDGFIADRNYTFYSDPANRKGSLDKYSVAFNKYALRDEGQESTGKQDSTITLERAVANYDFTLEFDRQIFNISIVPVLYNDKTSSSGAPHNEWKVSYSDVPYRSQIKIVNPKFGGDTIFYNNDNKLYSDPSCKQPIDNVTPEAIRDIQIYCKLIYTNVSKSQVRFYEYKKDNGYKLIQTGRKYVAIEISNGIQISESEYDWSDCIDGQTIIDLPIVTSFYWPDKIDDNDNVRFLYWVNLGDDLEVSYNDLGLNGKPITPDVLLQHFTIQQLKNVILLDCDGGFDFTGSPNYYAVYDIPDRKLEMAVEFSDNAIETNLEGAIDVADKIDDYIFYYEGGKYSANGITVTGAEGFYSSVKITFPLNKDDDTINNFGYTSMKIMIGATDVTSDCVKYRTEGGKRLENISSLTIEIPTSKINSNVITASFIDIFGKTQELSFVLGIIVDNYNSGDGAGGNGSFIVSTETHLEFTTSFEKHPKDEVVGDKKLYFSNVVNEDEMAGCVLYDLYGNECTGVDPYCYVPEYEVAQTYYSFNGYDYYYEPGIQVKVKTEGACVKINGQNIFNIPTTLVPNNSKQITITIKGRTYMVNCYRVITDYLVSSGYYIGSTGKTTPEPDNRLIYRAMSAGYCSIDYYDAINFTIDNTNDPVKG